MDMKATANEVRVYEARGVLAGCYRGARGRKGGGPREDQTTRSHYYDVTDGDWASETTLCNRIKDATGRLSDVAEAEPADCPECAARFARRAAKGLAIFRAGC